MSADELTASNLDGSLVDRVLPAHSPNAGLDVLAAVRGELGQMRPRLRLLNSLLFFAPPLCFNRFRSLLYRLAGVAVGQDTIILGAITLSGSGPIWSRLAIGRRCVIGSPLHLDLNAAISIGDCVSIGHHAIFITTDHQPGGPTFRCGAASGRPIVVENGSWIGACAVLLPGVRIGAGSVVCAGAVVASDVPAHRMVGGNPARVVRSLDL